ncbi:MAG: tetratricopeptide repeat protein [Candidatus Omnitrophota bacterium]
MAYPSYRIDKKDIYAVFSILAFALLVRAAYFIDYINVGIYPLLPYSDGYSYFLWAKDIASGEILGRTAFMKWPLYAYFLGLLFKVTGNSVTLVYTLQLALGAVNCVLVYFIARIIFNRKTALLAGLSCAWYAVFIFYDSLLIYSSLSLFLNSLLFLFILRLRDNPAKKSFFLLGILLGICTITQASIFLFGAMAMIFLLWQKRGRGRGVVHCLICSLAGLFITIAPVTLMNYLAEKDPVLISGNIGINFYLGNNPEAGGLFNTPLFLTPNQNDMFRDSRVIAQARSGRRLKTSGVSAFWLEKAVNFIKQYPRAYLALLIKKTGYLFSPDEFIHDPEYEMVSDKIRVFKFLFTNLKFILPFSILGMFLGIRRLRETALLYLVLAALAFSVIPFFVTTRYRISMVPFLIIFASYGILGLWEALKERKRLRFFSLCAAALFLFTLFNYRLLHKNKSGYLQESYLDFHSHLSRAMYYNDKPDYQKAMQEIEAAYRLRPDSHYCLISYGVIYYNMHNFNMAEDKFREAIRVFPLSVDAYYNLGLLYNQQKRFEEAIAVLNEALSMDPEDVGAHFELGRAYKGRGRYGEAEVEFRASLDRINRWRTEERALIAKELSGL